MRRILVTGDIHGAARALQQCLERCNFDRNNDHLICLGDVADGWPETKAAVDELLQITNLTYILGNHDWWTLQWMRSGTVDQLWYDQGGKATIDSYQQGIPDEHIAFFSNAHFYYVLNNRLFVHAGFNPAIELSQQDKNIFLWDRSLASLVLDLYPHASTEKISAFDEIYIGHTPIPHPMPIQSMSVWLMDTGAGWSGVLSMMDVYTKETFISDPVPSLYPGIEGRKKLPR